MSFSDILETREKVYDWETRQQMIDYDIETISPSPDNKTKQRWVIRLCPGTIMKRFVEETSGLSNDAVDVLLPLFC